MEGRLLRFLRHDVVRRTFGIDLRSLAALRIGLGLLLLADLGTRAPFLSAHLSDSGILPREDVSAFTLYSLGGSTLFAGFLFAVAAAFALLLLVGRFTRVATLASWVLLVSLHLRNPYLIDSGDKLLALLLFWGIFLPLGTRASLDARTRGPSAFETDLICTPASLALLLQVAFVYVFSALLKDGPLWLKDGTAIYYALHVDLITTDFGRSLLRYPAALRVLSRGTWLLELFGPFLAFVPVGSAWFRIAMVAAFVALHIGFALCFHLVLFPYVCIVAWLAFLPSAFWDALQRTRIAQGTRSFASTLIRGLPRSRRGPSPSLGTAAEVLAAVILVYVFWWNAGTVLPKLAVPESLRPLGEQLCLRQKWSMFASPLRADGWWVMPATLQDGSEVDLHTGAAPVRWEKPEDVAATFPTSRCMKWLTYAWGASGPEHRDLIASYAAWLRREWDARHAAPERVESLRILYRAEETRPDDLPPYRCDLLLYEWKSGAGEHVVPFAESLVALQAARAAGAK